VRGQTRVYDESRCPASTPLYFWPTPRAIIPMRESSLRLSRRAVMCAAIPAVEQRRAAALNRSISPILIRVASQSTSQNLLCRIAVYSGVVDDAPEIAVLQLPKFKAEATELIGTDGIEALAVYLIDHPDAGDVIPGSGGVRKLRWAAKGKGKRGGARIIYLYVVIAARIFLIRCYAKNVKTDLTADEKKQIAADRGPSERSTIECPRKPVRRRLHSART